jgi:plasmid stabilization system protein ParE
VNACLIIRGPAGLRAAFEQDISFSEAAHNIFFREDQTGILVIRILHQRMDVKSHL